MIQFPGQMSRMGFTATQGNVWRIKPYVVKVFFAMKTKIQAFFIEDIR